MPGLHEPADPQDINKSVNDISARRAGAQVPPTDKAAGAQFEHGEAPRENAYREKANVKR